MHIILVMTTEAGQAPTLVNLDSPSPTSFPIHRRIFLPYGTGIHRSSLFYQAPRGVIPLQFFRLHLSVVVYTSPHQPIKVLSQPKSSY